MFFFLRSLPRLIHNANKDMRRHFSMTFSSVVSISIALLLSMVMIVIALNVDHISSSVESQLTLQVSLSPVLTEEQKSEVYEEMMKIDGVASAEYSSKEEELNKLIAENGAMFSQYENSNPLYDVYLVELDPVQTIASVSEKIRDINGVAQVDYGGSSVAAMISFFESMRSIGYAAALGLMILGVILIRNTIEMTIGLRQDEIFIMRTVGAYNFYILLPFILEGLFMGFFAALFPAAFIGLGYPWLYYGLDQVLPSLFGLLPPSDFMPSVLAYNFGTGLLLGALGSWMAVSRKIRRVR